PNLQDITLPDSQNGIHETTTEENTSKSQKNQSFTLSLNENSNHLFSMQNHTDIRVHMHVVASLWVPSKRIQWSNRGLPYIDFTRGGPNKSQPNELSRPNKQNERENELTSATSVVDCSQNSQLGNSRRDNGKKENAIDDESGGDDRDKYHIKIHSEPRRNFNNPDLIRKVTLSPIPQTKEKDFSSTGIENFAEDFASSKDNHISDGNSASLSLVHMEQVYFCVF
ncbi:hypothetical protein RFI_21995, partial [Reticulomyxa filosa]